MSRNFTCFRTVRLWDRKLKTHVETRVDLEIDLDGLAQSLGQKALENKSRKSKLAAGVKAEILRHPQ